MTILAAYKKPIFLSLTVHILAFSVFSLSFGRMVKPASFSGVSFLGGIFTDAEIKNFARRSIDPSQSINFSLKTEPSVKKLDIANNLVPDHSYLKPQPDFSLIPEKLTPSLVQAGVPPSPMRQNKPAVVFHPFLPHSFQLYFRDRQVAHVQLLFNILPSKAGKSPILIKRKITSGNPEVDLLTMRYISHYLFIQQASFLPEHWQTVKIDLSADR